MDNLIDFVNYILIIAIAAERFTDIVKRTYLERFNLNSGIYQIITVCFGMVLGYLQPVEIKAYQFNEYVQVILVGLMVSGTSSFWHEILSVLGNLKTNLKENPSVKES